jgi:hypothetical protein
VPGAGGYFGFHLVGVPTGEDQENQKASLPHGVLTLRQLAAGRQPPPGQGDRPAVADDLEELRLEIAALRKGLEATRARVKALEGEVQTLRDRGGRGGFGGGGGNFGGGPGAMFDRFADGKPVITKADVPAWLQDRFDQWTTNGQLTRDQFIQAMQTQGVMGMMGGPGMGRGGMPGGQMPGGMGMGGAMAGQMQQMMGGGGVRMTNLMPGGPGMADTRKPLTEAEAALKMLQANPKDKQALDKLANALKQLKDREYRDPVKEAPKGENRSYQDPLNAAPKRDQPPEAQKGPVQP